MPTPVRALQVQTDATKALIASMRDTLGDDDQLLADMVEGETELLEAIQGAVHRIGEIDALTKSLSDYSKSLASRKSRLEVQAENLRAAIAAAMTAAGMKSHELPDATITLRDKAREPVIVNEDLIPKEFWKPQPSTLDRSALREAVKSGRNVPGVDLNNGGTSLTIRRS